MTSWDAADSLFLLLIPRIGKVLYVKKPENAIIYHNQQEIKMLNRLSLSRMSSCLNVDDPLDREHSNIELIRLFYQIQHAIKPTTFIEVGAFEGEFSRNSKHMWPDARVLAFEANPYNHSSFAHQHGFAALGIEYLNKAVSDIDGSISFQIQKSINGQNLAASKRNDSLIVRVAEGIDYDVVTVPSIRLDSIIQPGERVSIWMDVEGAQKQVLLGAAGCMDQIMSIHMEVEEQAYWQDQWLFSEIDDFLDKHGMIAIARNFVAPYQFDVLFVQKSIMQIPFINYALVEHASRLGNKRP